MTRSWFTGDLETTATWLRMLRKDGVTMGFTTHDRDLWFDGVLHRASPGMVPSAIRKSADFEADSAEVSGSLADDSITADDLANGRFDGAQVRIGLVDWETLELAALYAGTIGSVSAEDEAFSIELTSRKAELWRDDSPRTSPACRATFCGPGCNLNPAGYTCDVRLAWIEPSNNAVIFEQALDPLQYAGGSLRWLDGPQAGLAMTILGEGEGGGFALDVPLDPDIPAGTAAMVREGCDHTLETCATRFTNAVNFRGEPFLPGNDLLTRYPSPGE